LFRDAPRALWAKVEQVVRLIRSKGVGVYFGTQNPLDIPDTVSRQLGNRVQHALRAFTPAEQKAVRAAAQTFRRNPKIDTEQAIMQLGIGEALVSTLDAKGQPSMVERTLVKPPNARVGTVDKFQGQEAPVVIFSMASSSPEDAPRGMEFLYSLNRLNVATSRARCAAIVVASPALFEPECRTPRQMQLANALCRFVELAARDRAAQLRALPRGVP